MSLDRYGSVSSARLAVVLAAAGLLVVLSAGCRREPPAPEQGPTPATEAEAQTLADFQQRVNTYVELHRRVESALPPLPKEATPQQIDSNQRNLGKLMVDARRDAKAGDLFTPAMQRLVRDHFKRVFEAKDGEDLKGSVMDENPLDIKVSVNQRYPDEVPLSTMPPEVLQLLPKMPEELEYRFVGKYLVIMDAHAHLIADVVPNAIP